MKTIIVPLDFSNEAMTGLEMALMLANKTGAHIKMVHVITKDDSESFNLEKIRQKVTLKFEDIIENHATKSISRKYLSYTIKEGKVFYEITNLADTIGDCVIVLSTHGHSGFEELFLGGNAYKIVSHSKFPVITVRRSGIPKDINKIVLPIDISFETREKVPYTVHLAKLFHSEIHILVVQISNYEDTLKKLHQYSKQVGEYIQNHNIPFVIEEVHGDYVTDLTLEYANTINADLISIMTEQEEGFANLILGTNAHQMINQSFIPVLCFPNYQVSKNTESFFSQDKSYR